MCFRNSFKILTFYTCFIKIAMYKTSTPPQMFESNTNFLSNNILLMTSMLKMLNQDFYQKRVITNSLLSSNLLKPQQIQSFQINHIQTNAPTQQYVVKVVEVVIEDAQKPILPIDKTLHHLQAFPKSLSRDFQGMHVGLMALS